jgi:kynurenine formamidase
MKIIDLTHKLSDKTSHWDVNCKFDLKIVTDYKDCATPDLFRTQNVNMPAGIGTHMDAPAHCMEGGKTIDMLSMGELVTECVVIDVSTLDENFVAMPEVVEEWEKEHGQIKENSFVIFHTGWSKYWDDGEKYRNNYKFPTVHATTADLLVKRNIAGLGIDTLSVDNGSAGFPVHRIILSSGKYLVENIANAGDLPKVGAKIFVLPIKIEGGTEAPIRLVAIINS